MPWVLNLKIDKKQPLTQNVAENDRAKINFFFNLQANQQGLLNHQNNLYCQNKS